MSLQESFHKLDKPVSRGSVDVRKEAQAMVRRHERQLKDLKESTPNAAAFREAALKSTEAFKIQLKDFLSANGAEDLYEELVGFVSGKVSEVTASHPSSHA